MDMDGVEGLKSAEVEELKSEGGAPTVQGWRPPMDISELGIRWRRFWVPGGYEKWVCAWRNEHHAHVYELEVAPWKEGWAARGFTDGKGPLFELRVNGRDAAQRLGFAAMRAWLRRSHRNALRTMRRLAGDGSPHPEGVGE